MSDQDWSIEISKRYKTGKMGLVFCVLLFVYFLVVLLPISPELKEKFEILSFWGQAVTGFSIIFLAFAFVASWEAMRMQREQLEEQRNANLEQTKLLERTAKISALAAAMEACAARLKYVEVNPGILSPQEGSGCEKRER